MSNDNFFQKRHQPVLLSLLLRRTQGFYSSSPNQFQKSITRLWWENNNDTSQQYSRNSLQSQAQKNHISPPKIQLLHHPEIISPHQSGIPTLSYDRVNGRFLLAGSLDGAVSIYDLSKWGSEQFLRRDNYSHRKGQPSSSFSTKNHNDDKDDGQYNIFRPIARTLRVPSTLRANDEDGRVNALPEGHFSSLTHVQWYPVDTGAFLSASLDGSILFWDTNRMQPVLHATPFEEGYSCSCAHLGGGGPGGGGGGDGSGLSTASSMLVAAGSWQDPTITLVDLRSGAASHQLQGHDRGISCLSWSPTSSVILASGCQGGSIRLWDIRKSGSRACVTQLHRQQTTSQGAGVSAVTNISGSSGIPYSPDYTHLNKVVQQRHEERMVQRQHHHYQQQRDDSSDRGGKRPRRDNKKPKMTMATIAKLRQSSSSQPVAPNNYSHVQHNAQTLLRPHNGIVSNLAFFPDGHSMATVGGTDGELVLWDLTKSIGQVISSKFVAPGGQSAAGRSAGGGRRRSSRIPLCVDRVTEMIWIGHKADLLGFHPEGGRPKHILKGHLHHITAMETMDHSLQLLTASADGMILTWGKKRAPSPSGTAVGQMTRRPTRLQDEDNW